MSGTLDALIDALGEIDTATLLRARGGTEIEVPTSAPGSQIAGLVGDDAASRLIKAFGPGRLLLPMGAERGQRARARRAKKLLTEGASARDVAAQADVHVRTVHRYARAIREDRQTDLFDE